MRRPRPGGGPGSPAARRCDRDQAPVPDPPQLRERGPEIQLALAELEVLVNAAAHVLGVHVCDAAARTAHTRGDRFGFGAEAVTDVEREESGSVVERVEQPRIPCEVVDHHAGFRLQREPHAVLVRGFEHTQTAVHEPPPRLVRRQHEGGGPDHRASASAPRSAAMAIPRRNRSRRRSRPGDMSVRSCLRRGSSRNRAPVSTTTARPTGPGGRGRIGRARRRPGRTGQDDNGPA